MTPLEERLVGAVLADPACAAVLGRTPSLGLADWWLTGGAVFQNVWNAVTGRPPGEGVADLDLFSFDDDLSWEAEDRVIRSAAALFADIDRRVEVRNQARVHLWYAQRFGVDVRPFERATDGIDAFAATTCCVGVRRSGRRYEVHAPHGLDDVFAMRLRPNPVRAPRAVYEAKADSYRRRWPALVVDPWPGPA